MKPYLVCEEHVGTMNPTYTAHELNRTGPMPFYIYFTWWGDHAWSQKSPHFSGDGGASLFDAKEPLETMRYFRKHHNDYFGRQEEISITDWRKHIEGNIAIAGAARKNGCIGYCRSLRAIGAELRDQTQRQPRKFA